MSIDHDKLTKIEARVDGLDREMAEVKATTIRHGIRILSLETRLGLGAFFGTALGSMLAKYLL